MNSRFSPLRSRTGAFTLIEILVTLAIVGMLVAGTISYMQSSQRKARISDTEQRLRTISTCLAAYEQDRGELPAPKTGGDTGTFKGKSYPIAGAACLYQALTGDGNDQIEGYRAATNKGESAGSSTGEMGSTSADFPLKNMNVATTTWWVRSNDKWVILDGFGTPWQYRIPTRENTDKMFNPESYDLWSFSGGEPNEMDEEGMKQWIKNW
jgi:prepilin-type N-terminal cleavage/methylation domain-containing protein